MRLIFIIPLLISSFALLAQTHTLTFANLQANLGSNSVPAYLGYQYLNGRKITNSDVDELFSNLPELNTVSAQIRLDWIKYAHLPETGFGLSYGISDNIYTKATFDSELLRAIWYGTKQYAGQTIEIENSEIQSLRFRRFDFGFRYKAESNWVFTFIPGITQTLAATQTDESNIQATFAQDGSYIDFTTQVEARYTDQSRVLVGNGIGLSLQTGIEYKSDKSSFKLLAHNIGFTQIRNGVFASSQKSYRYTGVDIFDSTSRSTIEEVLAFDTDTNSFSVPLPTYLQIQFEQKFGSALALELQATQPLVGRYFTSSAPYLQSKLHIGLKNIFKISPEIRYQSAEGLSTGIGLELGLKYLSVGTYIGGFDIANTTGGNIFGGVKLSIQW